eukprot:CAMPEP_0113650460 /NCGR_PEP_ID=MMETSP0017_2-20120614/26855_1 /TAXON_ID=2856 /ORGANISM="Cylindrotheca closterium" /LENGTH=92 /DNA_ID=CAMNT_0000562983 /DNA_START=69 /DNA_END=343 /DNA_ORIENTATION=+ /assembly_acc=CAM_ASM_000147
MLSIPFITLLLIATLQSSSAFVPQASHCSQSSSSSTLLQVGISYDEDDLMKHHEAYPQLLQRANDCAKSEECSLEEWETVMTEIEYISEMDS